MTVGVVPNQTATTAKFFQKGSHWNPLNSMNIESTNITNLLNEILNMT